MKKLTFNFEYTILFSANANRCHLLQILRKKLGESLGEFPSFFFQLFCWFSLNTQNN